MFVQRRIIKRSTVHFSHFRWRTLLNLASGKMPTTHKEVERKHIPIFDGIVSTRLREHDAREIHFSKWLTRPLMIRTHEQDTNLRVFARAQPKCHQSIDQRHEVKQKTALLRLGIASFDGREKISSVISLMNLYSSDDSESSLHCIAFITYADTQCDVCVDRWRCGDNP